MRHEGSLIATTSHPGLAPVHHVWEQEHYIPLQKSYKKGYQTRSSNLEASGQSRYTLTRVCVRAWIRPQTGIRHCPILRKPINILNRTNMPSDRDQLLEFGFEAARVDCLLFRSSLPISHNHPPPSIWSYGVRTNRQTL